MITNDALTNDDYAGLHGQDVNNRLNDEMTWRAETPIVYVRFFPKCRKTFLHFLVVIQGESDQQVKDGERNEKRVPWRWNGNGGDKSGTPRGFERAVIRYPFFSVQNVGCGSGGGGTHVNGIARQSAHDVMSPSSGVDARNRNAGSFRLVSFLYISTTRLPTLPTRPSMIFSFFFYLLDSLLLFMLLSRSPTLFYQYQTTH